jgi:hypothetical protein
MLMKASAGAAEVGLAGVGLDAGAEAIIGENAALVGAAGSATGIGVAAKTGLTGFEAPSGTGAEAGPAVMVGAAAGAAAAGMTGREFAAAAGQ